MGHANNFIESKILQQNKLLCSDIYVTGMRFALTQSKAAVAEILRNFEVTVNPKTKEPLVLDPKSFSVLPIGGLWVDFEAL